MSGSGIRIEVPDAPAPVAHELVLPSGIKASVRVGTGRDLRLAQAATGQPFDAGRFEYALIAQVADVDGKKLTLGAVDAMPIGDVLALQAEVNRLNFPTKVPAE